MKSYCMDSYKSSLKNDNIKDIDSVCICIGEVNSNQRHIGFLYNSYSNEKVMFLHLAWHNQLCFDDTVNTKYLWLNIPFDEYNMMNFQIFLDMVYDENKERINYGISIDGIEVKPNGSIVSEDNYAGLTCATFVMQVLHSQAYVIIDLESWERREEDDIWQNYILSCLEESATDKYYKEQKLKIGSLRFKPEEVAIASHSEEIPMTFQDIQEAAEKLLILLSVCAKK